MAVRGTAAVFVDKDGTLIENLPYNVDPSLIRLSHGAGEGLRALARAGFKLVSISNQSGVERGFFDERALGAVYARIQELCAAYDVRLDAFYHCPHLPGSCSCRKPAPGLLQRAAGDLDLDLAGSWMVGDILDDVEAGRRAGCRTVLLAAGNETEWDLNAERVPDQVATDLTEAAAGILRVSARADEVTAR